MHSGPSVSYPAGRSLFAAAFLLAAWLLGCATAALWWLHAPDAWRLAAMAAALASTGAFAARAWWQAPRGTLDWDGEAWAWSGHAGTGAGRLEVALDLQHTLLVRWRSGGASQWLWLSRLARTERWDDLRRAVYSRARPQALHHAEPPAATP